MLEASIRQTASLNDTVYYRMVELFDALAWWCEAFRASNPACIGDLTFLENRGMTKLSWRAFAREYTSTFGTRPVYAHLVEHWFDLVLQFGTNEVVAALSTGSGELVNKALKPLVDALKGPSKSDKVC